VPGLDPRTLLVVSAAIPLALMAILLGVRTLRQMPAGFGVWTASQGTISLGVAVIAARGYVPDWVSIVAGNTLVVVGIALIDEGYRRFYGLRRSMPRWVDAAVVATTVVLSTFFLDGSVNARVVNASLAYAFFLSRAGIEPLRSPEARRSPAQRVVAFLALVGAALLVLRGVRAALAPAYPGLFAEGWPVIIPGIVLTLVNVTSMYVALLLAFERSERELRTALSEVKTLSGLLPICMHCHKIRNDLGYWDQLERYLARHTEARFSHGICPDCYSGIYGGGPGTGGGTPPP
jgi:hypothetical protein